MEAGFLLFTHTKNKEPREVPFAGPMRETLEAQRAKHPEAETEFVFVRDSGKPIKDFRRAWKLAVESTGLEGHRWHGNRRSLAMNLIKSGADEQTAMTITGHKDGATFRGYRVLLRRNKLNAAQRLTDHLNGSGTISGTAAPPKKSRARK